MRIYEISTWGEKEWVVANTTIEALQVYRDITDNDIGDFSPSDDIEVVSDERLDFLKLSSPDDPELEEKTFREVLNETEQPEYIGSTVY